MMKELSIIIPTLNEEFYLPRVLQSIAEQDFYGKTEVIIVDGGSTDNTIGVVDSFRNKISNIFLLQTGKGIGRARNVGAAKAKYAHLLFLDSDIFLPPHFLARLAGRVRHNERFVALVLHIPERFNALDYLWVAFVFGFYAISRFFSPVCSGTFLLTTKDNHNDVGGFDERIVMGEDAEYGRRSIARGACYHLYFWPHVRASVRRLREVGRIRMLWGWTKIHVRALHSGPIYKNDVFEYPFGVHKKDH